jgi:hypothetical protein
MYGMALHACDTAAEKSERQASYLGMQSQKAAFNRMQAM